MWVLGVPDGGPGCSDRAAVPELPQVSSVGPGAVQPLCRARAHPPRRLFLQSPQELDEARSFLESSASFQPRGKRCCGARAKSSHEEPPSQAGGGPRERMDRRTDRQIRPFPGPAAVGLVGDLIWGGHGWEGGRSWGGTRLPKPPSHCDPKENAKPSAKTPCTPRQARQHWHSPPRAPLPKGSPPV